VEECELEEVNSTPKIIVQSPKENIVTDKSYKAKTVAILTLMFSIFSVCFCLFAFVLRKGKNLLIPLALFFQTWAYVITPLILMTQNEKLRNFTLKIILENKEKCFKALRRLKKNKSNAINPHHVMV
jgi:hypothetical protein